MKKLVILSGAGMSAESGISTFRDSDGLWENYPVEQVATPEGFAANPQMVLDFYNQRRRQLINVKPNEGHMGLAKLEQYFDTHIITQNIDNLHEQAGSTNVLHLHGEVMKAQSTEDASLIYNIDPQKCDINLGDKCELGSQLRPFIVWFGEAVPMIEPAVKIVQEADVFVIIGTSMNVYPAAGLLNYAQKNIPIYLIDPKDVKTYRSDVFHIKKGASEGVSELTKILMTN